MTRFNFSRLTCAFLGLFTGLIVSGSAASHDEADHIGKVHFSISCGDEAQREAWRRQMPGKLLKQPQLA